MFLKCVNPFLYLFALDSNTFQIKKESTISYSPTPYFVILVPCFISSFHSFAVPCVYHLLSQIGFIIFFLICKLANLSHLLSNYDFLLPITSCSFSIQRRPFSISFRVGLVFLCSFSFCLSQKSFIFPPIINDNCAGQNILG